MHSEVLGVGVTNGLISRSCCYEMGSPRLGWLRQRSSWLRSTWPESANPSSTSVNEGSFLNLSGICPSIVFGLVIPSRNLENFYWILNVFKGFQLRMEDQIRRLPHDVSSWSQKWRLSYGCRRRYADGTMYPASTSWEPEGAGSRPSPRLVEPWLMISHQHFGSALALAFRASENL